MVTNRRVKEGKYSDEEKLNKKFEYQYSYSDEQDFFNKTGKKG
jgi:hypothetical protein